jgi:hypothetical protein
MSDLFSFKNGSRALIVIFFGLLIALLTSISLYQSPSILGVRSGPTGTFYFSGGGSGTAGDPYLVTTCAQIAEVDTEPAAYYLQTTDIDCTGTTPVINNFSGEYDGGNYSIDNLTMATSSTGTALFLTVNGGTIKDINLTNVLVTDNIGDGDTIGTLVGTLNGGTVEHCSATGSMIEQDAVQYLRTEQMGGLIAVVTGTGNTITDSWSNVTMNFNDSIYDTGGLIGHIEASATTISNSYAAGNITGGAYSYFNGGFVGWVEGDVTIDNCHATGDITTEADEWGGGDSYDTGGFVGMVGGSSGDVSTITNSYATGNVSSQGEDNWDLGGFVGMAERNSVISECYATGNVSAQTWQRGAGGFVGLTRSLWGSGADPLIEISYTTGDVSVIEEAYTIGGFIGEHRNGTIRNCYTRSNVIIGPDIGSPYFNDIGGFAATQGLGNFINVYATGPIDINIVYSGEDVGGLIARNYSTGTTTDSYWDTQLSGWAVSDGGTGKTTAEMKLQSTFPTWDFTTIWNITPTLNDGYPQFQGHGLLACGVNCTFDHQCAGSPYPYTCDEIYMNPAANKCEIVESYCTSMGQYITPDECGCTASPPTDTPTPTNTPVNTATPTITNTPTNTLTPTPTNTLVPTNTPLLTNTPVPTATPGPGTIIPTATATTVPTYTPTPIGGVPTNTPTPTNNPNITGTPGVVTGLDTPTPTVSGTISITPNTSGTIAPSNIINTLPETGGCDVVADAYLFNNELRIQYEVSTDYQCGMLYAVDSVASDAGWAEDVPNDYYREYSISLADIDLNKPFNYQIICGAEDYSQNECNTGEEIIPITIKDTPYPTKRTRPVDNNDLNFSLSEVLSNFEVLTNTPAIAVGIPAVSSLFIHSNNLANILRYGMVLLRGRYRKRKWGVVYNQKTDKPIPFAAVRISQDGNLIKEVITDMDGIYGLEVDQGKYTVSVEHNQFKSFAKEVEVTTGAEVMLDIPLEPGELAEVIGEPEESELKKWLKKNYHKLVIITAVYSILITLLFPNPINVLISVIYAIQLIIYLRDSFYNKQVDGIIVKDGRGSPLAGVSIRIMSESEGRQLEVLFTGENGRPNKIRLDDGMYRLLAYKEGWNMDTSGHQIAKGTGNLKLIEFTVSEREFKKISIKMTKS